MSDFRDEVLAKLARINKESAERAKTYDLFSPGTLRKHPNMMRFVKNPTQEQKDAYLMGMFEQEK
jgi:hypothetical protein